MVEVFKTNVTQKKVAEKIVLLLHEEFTHYRVNFDLGDVDRILRIVYSGSVDVPGVISALQAIGFHAEVLPDTPVSQAIENIPHLSKTDLQLLV